MTTTNAELVAQLEQLAAKATADFKRTFHRAPSRWLQMVDQHGGVLGACQAILKPGYPDAWWQEILTSNVLHSRLDHSVEAWAQLPELEPLFTAEERAVAKMRWDWATS